LESGVRFHTTCYTREKSDVPSPVSMKLRKHIRGKRLVDVSQLGVDRVVDFTFGSGEAEHHILLELYAQVTFSSSPIYFKHLYRIRAHTVLFALCMNLVYGITIV
jgi:predicted ribosome quality control (RQC) complex YloA/Tae2 family protein